MPGGITLIKRESLTMLIITLLRNLLLIRASLMIFFYIASLFITKTSAGRNVQCYVKK